MRFLVLHGLRIHGHGEFAHRPIHAEAVLAAPHDAARHAHGAAGELGLEALPAVDVSREEEVGVIVRSADLDRARVQMRRAGAERPAQGQVRARERLDGALAVGCEEQAHAAGLAAELRRHGSRRVARREGAEAPGALEVLRRRVPAVVARDVLAQLRLPVHEAREDGVLEGLAALEAQAHFLDEQPQNALHAVRPAEGAAVAALLERDGRRHAALAEVDERVVEPRDVALRCPLLGAREAVVVKEALALRLEPRRHARGVLVGAVDEHARDVVGDAVQVLRRRRLLARRREGVAHAEADVVVLRVERLGRAVQRAAGDAQRVREAHVQRRVRLDAALQRRRLLLVLAAVVHDVQEAAEEDLRVLALPRSRIGVRRAERIQQLVRVDAPVADAHRVGVGALQPQHRQRLRPERVAHPLRTGPLHRGLHKQLADYGALHNLAKVPNLRRPRRALGGRFRQRRRAGELNLPWLRRGHREAAGAADTRGCQKPQGQRRQQQHYCCRCARHGGPRLGLTLSLKPNPNPKTHAQAGG
mmetsp:Transcript_31550/g.100130  ORF Transcript_31550/g.100130 Transcript_31550/m.100130 type:complete len:532 (-) Transcript_31550:121-1716(-)